MKYILPLVLMILFSGCATKTSEKVNLTEGTGTSHVFVERELDEYPKLVKIVMPIYPPELESQGIEGNVDLFFIIDEKGKITDIEVIKADHDLFAESAVKAFYQCRYTPPTIDGVPVKARYRTVIPFRL